MHLLTLAVLSSGLLASDVPPAGWETASEVVTIQGRWACTAERINGVDLAAEDVNGVEWVEWNIQANELVICNGGLVVSRGAFASDLSRNPPEIVFRVPSFDSTGYGIYRVHGDWIDLAYVYDGPRPTRFVSEQGSKVILLRLRRVKK